MKLRILDNSIRYRLTRTEVDDLGQGQTVSATTEFPDGSRFEYELAPVDDGQLRAHFTDQKLCIEVLAVAAKTWASNEEVALVDEAIDGLLSVLIEKDFNCLHPRDSESQEDTFTNPASPP